MKFNTIFKKLSAIIIVLVLALMNIMPAFATPAEDLVAIQRKLAEIRAQKAAIQNNIANQNNQANAYLREINTLKNKIDLLDTQISEKQLIIDELNLQIQIMGDEIVKTEQEIAVAQGEVLGLQIETDNRMIDIYISQKTNSSMNYVFSNGKKDIVKMSVYQSSIQDETNSMLYELNSKKIQLAEDEITLEQNKQSVEQDKALIEAEKQAIENSKLELDQQRAVYSNKRSQSLAAIGSEQAYLNSVTLEEQKAAALQTQLEQIVFNSVGSVPNGTYVTAGTIIGYQGCTGYCTGPHLHFAVRVNGGYVNPCSMLPSGTISGCGVSGGSLIWPQTTPFIITSGYGPRWGSFHYGIDIASNWSQSAPIKAAHSGWLFRGFERCDTSNWMCKNGGANYVIICENQSNCRSGVQTLYWHLR